MKKNYLWMLVAILTCGLAVSMLTSCSDKDPVNPDPEIIQKLSGVWFGEVLRIDYDPDADENDVEYVLLSFDENGVITRSVYIGNREDPINHWERTYRHGIYTVNGNAGTLTIENFSETPATIKYRFDGDKLILEADDENDVLLSLHRPSVAELDLIAMFNVSLSGDDYVGKWFGVNEFNGLYTYMMLDFTEEGKLNTIRYSVYNDKVTRTSYTQLYDTADDDDEPTLEIHNSTDYTQSEFYYWSVNGKTLILEKDIDDEEVISSTYHALTKDDLELMAQLDKKS